MNSQGVYTPDILYCRDVVRRHDYDRYVLCMGVPTKACPALWTVMAFHYEIAKIREIASGMAGHVRLTWWRDALLKGEQTHEVLRALAHFDLPQDLLLAIIEARRADMDNVQPASLAELAGAQNAPLFKLCAHILGTDFDPEAYGAAYGLSGMLRALPHNMARGFAVLPPDAMAHIGMDIAQISHVGASAALTDVVREHALLAHTILARNPKPDHAFFRMLGAMTQLYLKRMERCGYNVFDARFSAPVPFLGIRVCIQSKRG